MMTQNNAARAALPPSPPKTARNSPRRHATPPAEPIQQRPVKRSGFTVQYTSRGAQRRQVSATANQPSPTHLLPKPGKAFRDDLNAEAQVRAPWVEQQNRLSQHHQRAYDAAAIVPGDIESETLALQLMISEAVRRQATAKFGQNALFLRTCSDCLAITGGDRNSADCQPSRKVFEKIYKVLLADITTFLKDHGYGNTVKSFLKIRPWTLTTSADGM